MAIKKSVFLFHKLSSIRKSYTYAYTFYLITHNTHTFVYKFMGFLTLKCLNISKMFLRFEITSLRNVISLSTNGFGLRQIYAPSAC